jgi:hypothetical protein
MKEPSNPNRPKNKNAPTGVGAQFSMTKVYYNSSQLSRKIAYEKQNRRKPLNYQKIVKATLEFFALERESLDPRSALRKGKRSACPPVSCPRHSRAVEPVFTGAPVDT